MRWSSVRVRLTVWYVVVLALVLTGFSIALQQRIRVSLAQSVDRDLEAGATTVTMRWANPRGAHIRREAEADPRFSPEPYSPYGAPPISRRELSHAPGTVSAIPPEAERERKGYFSRPRILNVDGNSMIPFLGDAPWDDDSFLLSLAGHTQFSNIVVDKERVRVYSTPIWVNGRVDGVVQVAHSLKEYDALNAGLVPTLLTLVPVALVVAAIGGLFLADRALRPVRSITQAAAQIGAEDLSRRLEVKGKDELSELATTFNAMVARLEEAFQQLEAAYEQQRRFVGDASHELRTPLTTIKANTSLALCGEHSVAEYREALEAADDAADTMNRIVQDLLLLARSDGGQLGLEMRPTAINNVVQRAIGMARHWEGARVRTELPEQAVGVMGDSHYLSRLLVNLLENASRHTPPDGEIVVTVRPDGQGAKIDAGFVTVSVRDTGEGIAPEHLPHVCERFYRVDASRTRARGGTGLGLAICRSIAQAHGGDLRVESELGHGTTVILTLRPAAVAPMPAVTDSVPSELVG